MGAASRRDRRDLPAVVLVRPALVAALIARLALPAALVLRLGVRVGIVVVAVVPERVLLPRAVVCGGRPLVAVPARLRGGVGGKVLAALGPVRVAARVRGLLVLKAAMP